MTTLASFVGPPLISHNTTPGNGYFKSNIVVFDSVPGTKTWVAPLTGQIRAAVVGGGAGGGSSYGSNSTGGPGGGYEEQVYAVVQGTSYSYTVGAPGLGGTSVAVPTAGGTSSFNSSISATGGTPSSSGGTPGVGSGGLVSTSGGSGVGAGGNASGHRFGNAPTNNTSSNGSGWTSIGFNFQGGGNTVDGFGLGLSVTPVDLLLSFSSGSDIYSIAEAGYGRGGYGASTNFASQSGGVGGGGGGGNLAAPGGIGGGGGAYASGNGANGGPGAMIIERLS